MKHRKSCYLLAFSGGYATMGIEMTTTRALAPFFGTSTFIWAAIIAVVMLLIFAGHVIGGWAADKDHPIEKICQVHIIASILVNMTSQTVVICLYAIFFRNSLGFFGLE